MQREQITNTIQNALRSKYDTMSINHSEYLILKTKEYIAYIQDHKILNDELNLLSKEKASKSEEINSLFEEIFADQSKYAKNKPKIDILYRDIETIEMKMKELFIQRSVVSEKLNGKYDEKIRKSIGGLVNVLNVFDYKIVSEKLSDDEIKMKMKNYYEQLLIETSESLTSKIEGYNPTNIILGSSEHDINFILSFENSHDRSFTINTIVAGGIVQTIHRRTLTNLHKGIAK